MLLGKRFADVFLPRQDHAAEVPESMLVRSALTVSNWSMFSMQNLFDRFS
jgi:hypothetical protein